LPGGGRLVGEDAVAAAVEMQVFGFIADLGERGQSGAGVKIHVAEIGVLGGVEADADGGGVAVADFKIDVADGGIECAGVGVGDGGVGRNAVQRRKRNAALRVGPCASKRQHYTDAFLKAGRVVGQYKDRARLAVAEQAHPGPDVNGAREAVSAFGDEDNSFVEWTVRFVDGGLQSGAVVGVSASIQIDCLGVIQPRVDDERGCCKAWKQ